AGHPHHVVRQAVAVQIDEIYDTARDRIADAHRQPRCVRIDADARVVGAGVFEVHGVGAVRARVLGDEPGDEVDAFDGRKDVARLPVWIDPAYFGAERVTQIQPHRRVAAAVLDVVGQAI